MLGPDGIINPDRSYPVLLNLLPMKKFIYKGITVVTTDFKELGTKGAEFITKDEPMQYYVSTKLIIRESL